MDDGLLESRRLVFANDGAEYQNGTSVYTASTELDNVSEEEADRLQAWMLKRGLIEGMEWQTLVRYGLSRRVVESLKFSRLVWRMMYGATSNEFETHFMVGDKDADKVFGSC